MKNRLSLTAGLCFVGILFALLVGCVGDSRVATVHGVVTLDGKPIENASVAFMPQAGGRPAFALTDADGKFELSTFGTADGALIGNHVVTITAVEERKNSKVEDLAEQHGSLAEVMQPAPTPKETWIVPEKFADSETSKLEFEVIRGQSNQADFVLVSTP